MCNSFCITNVKNNKNILQKKEMTIRQIKVLDILIKFLVF